MYTSNFVCSLKSGVRALCVHIWKEKPWGGSPCGQETFFKNVNSSTCTETRVSCIFTDEAEMFQVVCVLLS